MNKILHLACFLLLSLTSSISRAQFPYSQKITIADSLPSFLSGINRIEAEIVTSNTEQQLKIHLVPQKGTSTTFTFVGDSVLKLTKITPPPPYNQFINKVLRSKLSLRLDSNKVHVKAHKLPATILKSLFPKRLQKIKGYISMYLQTDLSKRKKKLSGVLVPKLKLFFDKFTSPIIMTDSVFISDNISQINNYKFYDEFGNTITTNGTLDLNNNKIDLAIQSDHFYLQSVSEKKTNPLEVKAFVKFTSLFQAADSSILHSGTIEMKDSSYMTFYPVSNQNRLTLSKNIVEFVSQVDTLSRKNHLIGEALWENYNANFDLYISPKTEIKIITHTRFEDYVNLRGKGHLKLIKEAGSQLSASGDLIVEEGKIVDGRFLKTLPVEANSQLNWNGFGLWPDLKILSLYKITTSVERLFGQESARQTDAEKMLYRRRLPFIVHFSITGRSDNPQFGFQIHQPTEYNASLNGRVLEKLNVINDSPYLSFLQGSSLISTKRFVGTTISDANVSNSEKAAKYIANLVTWLARKGLKGYNLRTQYYTYDDYGRIAQEPTWREFEITFSKNLFKNRFNLSLGGVITVENSAQQEIQNFGDRYQPSASITYFFNPRSTAYLQTFSVSNYTGILDRRVRASGVRFGVSRSFNHLSELWEN